MTANRHYGRVSMCILVVAALTGLSGHLWAERATPAALGGPDRYLTYVSTDKPIYRPGEKVYVRGVILKAGDHTPLPANQQAAGLIEVRGPKGDVVASGWVGGQDSVLGFSWEVPAEQAGGEYTAKVRAQGFPPAERKFDIRAYRAPRLKTQIVFLRDGYGPGDQAGATLHVERAEGGVPEGAEVTATARVDGEDVYTGAVSMDKQGNCTASFKLPDKIARGEGTLSFAIKDGGVVETAAKTIPILLQTVDLTMYPEGGELVAELPARVYLEARTPARKPADIAGAVVDADGVRVAEFRTEHEGRGRFVFTPKKGGRYTLTISEPQGIKTTYPLPEVKDAGAVIRAVKDVTDKGEAVQLKVGSAVAGPLNVTLCSREVEVASVKLNAQRGELIDVSLTPPSAVDGVLIATVWDEDGKPLAERLVYREPAKGLQVKVTPEQKSYTTGGKVNLTVETSDDQGKAVSAVVGLVVTDDSILELIEKREQAPRLPVMVLLENDVRELADAHVYLDRENPKASLAVDLLLGTQGWRRFAFVNVESFLKAHGDMGRRVLAMQTPMERWRAIRGAVGGAIENDGVDLFLGAEVAARPAAAPVPARRGKDALEALREVEIKANAPLEPPVGAKNELRMQAPADEKAKELAGERLNGDKKLAAAADRVAPALLVPMRDEDVVNGRARIRNDLVVVRVYAHELRPDRKPADRVDFTETLYWNAGVKTDEKTGKATVSFALNDAVTTFRVFADGFTSAGALGQGVAAVESIEPFYIEPKLPLEVTTGDLIRLPVGIVNGLNQELPGVGLTLRTTAAEKVVDMDLTGMDPKARRREIVDLLVSSTGGISDVIVEARAGAYSDRVTRKLAVKPFGFPVERAFGGMINAETNASHTVTIPETLVGGSLATNIAVYPTPLANLTEALTRLIQEPNGCFEQTSSTAYPLVMAQQYFMSHTGVEPALIERSRTMLDKGYAKLTSFECKEKGYEWFGADPGHEALTAYGLMEFTDMRQVREVDPKMTARTREWLLKRRDGKGGFSLNKKALDSFGRAPQETTNAYVSWALLEAGETGLDAEIAALKAKAESAQDTYVVALAANVLAMNKDEAAARKLRDALVKKQNKDGCVEGAVTSITCSGGDALKIETTSLAVLAWLRDPAFAGAVEKGIRFLADNCKAGRYGSTQSSILALRAIVNYDKSRAKPKAAGSVRLYVDGKPAGDAVEFSESTQGAIKLPELSEPLSPGKHIIELRMTAGSEMPYSLAVNYYDKRPASAPECKLGLTVDLANASVTEGAVTEANVLVTNRTSDGLPMPVAIVGMPGGLEPRHDQLKELVKSGVIAAYEVLGRDVVLYWRELKPGQTVRIPLSLVAAVPGRYTGPASRTYLYYTDEFKTWADGVKVDITPRAGT